LAITAMPRLQALAITTIGSPAAAPSVAAGRALERDDVDLVAGRREAVVEIRRDRMDELERAHLDDGRLLGADDGGAGNRGHTGADQEIAAADHAVLPC
jgi:hypothetical protein